jgi:hypothetical protein
MTTWNVAEITLDARYFRNDPDNLTLACKSVSEVLGKYIEEKGADESVMSSELKPPSLLARGVDLNILDRLAWVPNHITFRDVRTGEQRDFRIRSYSRDGDAAKFALGG